MRLSIVRMQDVQTLTRTVWPSMVRRRLWTLGLNVREVRGAFRFQRPECLWRMLRPKVVVLSQMSQRPAAMPHFRSCFA